MEIRTSFGGEGLWRTISESLGSIHVTASGQREKAIADILVGSKRIRIGAAPTGDHRAYLETQISRWTKAGLPIDICCLWGAVKGYGLDHTRLGADFADAMGVRRFVALDKAVREVYSPGLRVRLIRENVGELALSTLPHPSTVHSMSVYKEGLDHLTYILSDNGSVYFEDESERLAALGVEEADFLAQGRENAIAIASYLRASANIPDEVKHTVAEYATLQERDWRGIIPDSIRQWYTTRVTAEHEGEDPIKPIAEYFGLALARYKVGMYKEPIAPLKASFVPYPDGTEPAMRMGRLEYKVKDSKGNNTVPPWCGHCFLQTGQEYEPTIIGVREYKALDADPFIVTLSRAGAGVNLRADLLAA